MSNGKSRICPDTLRSFVIKVIFRDTDLFDPDKLSVDANQVNVPSSTYVKRPVAAVTL